MLHFTEIKLPKKMFLVLILFFKFVYLHYY